MSTVEEIKQAISKLSLSERGEIARWLHGWTDDEWDRQMKDDLAAGRLDAMLKEVGDDTNAGRLREMP